MSTMLGVLSRRSNSVSLSNVSNGCVSSECDQDTNELALIKRMELIESKHGTKKLLISLILQLLVNFLPIVSKTSLNTANTSVKRHQGTPQRCPLVTDFTIWLSKDHMICHVTRLSTVIVIFK